MKYQNEQEKINTLIISKETGCIKSFARNSLRKFKGNYKKTLEYVKNSEPDRNDQFCSICGLGPANSCCKINF